MFQTRKDVDKHVRQILGRLRDDEKKLRGYTVSKLYYKIGEYNTAVNYLNSFLSVNDNCPTAHKFLGQCYEKLKKPDKALAAYQRSLELDRKQPDLLVEVCQLLQSDELFSASSSKARYYYELAESQNIQNNAVLNLKLKYLEKSQSDTGNTQNMQELILKEVKSRPFDVGLRIRLLRHFLDQKKVEDAFRYAYDIEMKQIGHFRTSYDWYLVVADVLGQYKVAQSNETKLKQNWPFWLLSVISLERQLYLNLAKSPTDGNSITINLSESTNCLYEFDQLLNKVSTLNACPDQDKELGAQFIYHYRGQLCLHAATLLFKREIAAAPREQWRETTRIALPLLLLAYNCGTVDNGKPSLRTCSENAKQLINLWSIYSAFRCCQAGRTLVSCVDTQTSDNNNALANLRKICNEKYPVWSSSDEILNEIRRLTTDSDWRKRIHRILFSKINQSDITSSYFVKCNALEKPVYDWPQICDLERYEETSQQVEPSSISHLVYLALGFEVTNRSKESLTTISPDVTCLVFNDLNLTTSNLSNCGAETLNRLDVDAFLYAAAIQAKRNIEIDRALLNGGTTSGARSAGPSILPFANIANRLCTEEQASWWSAAYKVYNNITGDELADLRATLQHGIEAVRGVSGPKIDVIIVLKLGLLFLKRSKDLTKPNERSALEARTEALFKYGLYLLRLQFTGRSTVEPFRRLFKYGIGGSQHDVDKEINQLAEEAITFLAERYFKNHEYEECIEDLAGIKLPFATYFLAEAYRKMTELSNTAKKNRRAYLDKAQEFLVQTLNLLESPNVDQNHPLKSIVGSDMKRLQHESRKLETSFNDSFVSASNNSRNDYQDLNESIQRQRREVAAPVIINNNENVEKLIREMMNSLSLLREDVTDMRDRVQSIEEQLQKKSSTQTDAASVDPDDYYLLDEDLQQLQQSTALLNNTSMFNNVSRLNSTNQSQLNSFQQQPFGIPQDVASAAVLNAPPNLYREFNQFYNNLYGVNAYQPPNVLPNANNTPLRQGVQQLPLRGNFPPGQFPYGNDALSANFGMLPQLQPYPGLLQQTQIQNIPPMQTVQPIQPVQAAQPIQPLLQQVPTTPLQAGFNLQQQSIPTHQGVDLSVLQQHSTNAKPSVLKPWNPIQNNAPVEKGPPTNVVITSSDPVPQQNTAPSMVQATLSVTIPPQHIKNNSITPIPPSKANPTIAAALQSNNKATANSSGNVNLFEKTAPNNSSTPIVPLAQQQSIFGGLGQSKALSSTPFSSPALNLTSDKPSVEKESTAVSKPNPFASFSFASPSITNTSAASGSSLSLAKSNPAALAVGTQPDPVNAGVANASTSSNKDDEDDYVPTAHFEPVIALPELVDVKTGEENEITLFEHRAKLLRFVRESKEWKERGIGNMKLLVNKDDPNRVRLMMRREQVLKLCCNQMLTKETQFKKLPNSEVAMSWYGQDFSEYELQVELLAIRFKTADVCKQFHEAILKAQVNMTSGGESGGVQKPATIEAKPAATEAKPAGFGDKFKPKVGSWTCEGCYLTNKETDVTCPACNAPKDKNAVATNTTSTTTPVTSKFSFGAQPNTPASTANMFGSSSSKPMFSFGVQPSVTPSVTTSAAAPTAPAAGFGDQFKPKPGAWSCKDCYTSNTATDLYCLACEAPKDDTVPKKPPKDIFASNTTSKFTFGSQPNAQKTDAPTPANNFGGFQFGNLAAKTTPTPSKPIEMPKIEQQQFGFVFKPKSPGKAKSPLKAAANEKENEVSDDDNVEEEENNTYFTPVIALPDKIEVRTGEEEEEILYSHRAKLYRFKDSEWRERGLGDVKILQHKQTGRFRVVMRREQILKICLNHVLDRGVEYKPKDPKSWQFIANDFSEGEYVVEQLCLRFKSAEIAQEFKKAIDDALGGVSSKQNGGGHHTTPPKQSLDSKLSAEEAQKIKDLKLPANFFDYKVQPKCTGCRGCNPDDYVFSEIKETNFNVKNDNPLPIHFTPIAIRSDPQPTNLFGDFNAKLGSTTPVQSSNSFFFGANNSANASATWSFGKDTTESTPSSFGFNSAQKLPTNRIFSQISTGTVASDNDATSQVEPAKTPTFSFGSTSLFGGTGNSSTSSKTSIFGGLSKTTASLDSQGNVETQPTMFGSPTVFGQKSTPPVFGGNLFTSPINPTGQSTTGSFVLGDKTDTTPKQSIFGSNVLQSDTPVLGSDMSFGALTSKSTAEPSSIFKNDPGLSFADLAQATASTNTKDATKSVSGFFGLSNKDDFSNLMINKPTSNLNGSNGGAGNDNEHAEDANYDPHYDPIIALPDEIIVTTGEEEEIKLFGDRAKLYRYDATNKEWKERGVGEIKLLHHPTNNSYRLLLRREQVHKCVLNQGISADFSINPMKQSDKAFVWVGNNFAEDTQNGAVESLSIRFKNAIIAQSFYQAMTDCIDKLKARGGLEPEQD